MSHWGIVIYGFRIQADTHIQKEDIKLNLLLNITTTDLHMLADLHTYLYDRNQKKRNLDKIPISFFRWFFLEDKCMA